MEPYTVQGLAKAEGKIKGTSIRDTNDCASLQDEGQNTEFFQKVENDLRFCFR